MTKVDEEDGSLDKILQEFVSVKYISVNRQIDTEYNQSFKDPLLVGALSL